MATWQICVAPVDPEANKSERLRNPNAPKVGEPEIQLIEAVDSAAAIVTAKTTLPEGWVVCWVQATY